MEDLALEVVVLSGQTTKTDGLVTAPPQRLSEAWARFSMKEPDRHRLDPEEAAIQLRNEASYHYLPLPSGNYGKQVLPRNLEKAIQNLDALLTTPFARSRDFEARADLHAAVSEHWQEALRDYQEASRRRPESVRILGRVALLHFQIGDKQTYRDLCRDLVERFVSSRNPYRASQLALNCVDREAFAGFEKAAVAQAESLSESWGTESIEGWEYLALANYRAGNFKAAVEAAKPPLQGRSHAAPDETLLPGLVANTGAVGLAYPRADVAQ